jgi:hypothetical protein
MNVEGNNISISYSIISVPKPLYFKLLLTNAPQAFGG